MKKEQNQGTLLHAENWFTTCWKQSSAKCYFISSLLPSSNPSDNLWVAHLLSNALAHLKMWKKRVAEWFVIKGEDFLKRGTIYYTVGKNIELAMVILRIQYFWYNKGVFSMQKFRFPSF